MRRLLAGLGPRAVCAGRLRRHGTAAWPPAAAATPPAAPRPQAAPVKQRDSHFSVAGQLAVYYQRTFRGRCLAPGIRSPTRAVAAAAVTELLEGEPAPGSRRPLPAGTGLAALQVDNGSTVALSGAGLALPCPPGPRCWQSGPWSTP